MNFKVEKERLDSEVLSIRLLLNDEFYALLVMKPEDFSLDKLDSFLGSLQRAINGCIKEKENAIKKIA